MFTKTQKKETMKSNFIISNHSNRLAQVNNGMQTKGSQLTCSPKQIFFHNCIVTCELLYFSSFPNSQVATAWPLAGQLPINPSHFFLHAFFFCESELSQKSIV